MTSEQGGARVCCDARFAEQLVVTKRPSTSSDDDDDANLSAELQAAFGESVRTARMRAGLKQSDLSELTGIAREEISRIENGLVNITIKQMSRLARVLGNDVADMLKASQKSPRAE